jgi:hypothetical protein
MIYQNVLAEKKTIRFENFSKIILKNLQELGLN